MPPRGSRNLIPRDALMARMVDGRRRRCLVVQGAAGSGKTSALVEWRKALISLNFDIAWLSLAPEDNELSRFFDCLLASLAEVDAGIVRSAALLMGYDCNESAVEHWVITLVEAIAERQRELVLVLDDIHHIDDKRIVQALQWLLDYAPPQLHVAFGSRNALPLSLARLRAQGQVEEIDLRDLRFTAAESERFLREQLGRIDKRDAEILHELTDGWVAGLQLFAIDLKAKQGAPYSREQIRDARAFASYFEREVLVRLSPHDLDLLTRVAVCSRFCASLCASLSGRPQALARKMTWLTQMDSNNLFITQVPSHDRETWYRLHPLLREVLLERLARRPESEQRALHAAAWNWFASRGYLDEAVHHAVQADDANAAAEMVESCVEDLLTRGDMGQLSGLLRNLPPEHVEASIDLQLAATQLRLYARDIEGVERSLQGIESKRTSLDASQTYSLNVLRAGLAMRLDDPDAVFAIQNQLLNVPSDVSDRVRASGATMLSWMLMFRGEYAQMHQILDEAHEHGGAPFQQMAGRCIGALSLTVGGDMTRAEQILREVLEASEQQGPAYVGVTCMAAGILGYTLYESGQPEAAVQVMTPRIELLERVAIPDIVIRALYTLAACHWQAGRRLEAHASLDRLEDYAVRYQLDRLLIFTLMARLRFQLWQGSMEQAHASLLRMESVAAGHSGPSELVAAEIKGAAEQGRIIMMLHEKDFTGALARIDKLIPAIEATGKSRRLVALHVQSAVARQACGYTQSAREHMLTALKLAHHSGIVRTLLDASPAVPQMLSALMEEGALDPVLTFYVKRLQAAAGAAPQSGAVAKPVAVAMVEALSEREREVLSLVALAMPNKKIARAINVSPETVKWHLKNIFGKLGVSGRDEAVGRARDLKISLVDPYPLEDTKQER
jgi:LuxR family transcriptional regulator, maltose regulon positive regulatory protein